MRRRPGPAAYSRLEGGLRGILIEGPRGGQTTLWPLGVRQGTGNRLPALAALRLLRSSLAPPILPRGPSSRQDSGAEAEGVGAVFGFAWGKMDAWVN